VAGFPEEGVTGIPGLQDGIGNRNLLKRGWQSVPRGVPLTKGRHNRRLTNPKAEVFRVGCSEAPPREFGPQLVMALWVGGRDTPGPKTLVALPNDLGALEAPLRQIDTPLTLSQRDCPREYGPLHHDLQSLQSLGQARQMARNL
jgi:hypothetical protein